MNTEIIDRTGDSKPAAIPTKRRAFWYVALVPVALVLLIVTVWATAALYFDVRVASLGTPLAVAYVLAVLTVWILVKGIRRKLGMTALGFALVLGWWLTLQPSNERNWRPDIAVLPYAEINDQRVTIHNIRNCEYRTETDYDVRHYDKTFDLDQLRTVDLYMVYWGSPLIAHTMMSFGFADGEHVCFSIETRNQLGQEYSAVKGLFRQFQLTLVIADERDVVRLRTNYRQGEDVYLYRLRATPASIRQLFLDYLQRANRLRQSPEWYNAVTDNCTTGIRAQRAATDRAPWDWRMLVNGHGDELLYERGVFATNVPLAELKERGHVNTRARAADKAEDFSMQIRQGVPGTGL